MNLPEDYLNEMQELFGSDYESYLDSFHNERVYGLRVNTSKISVEEFLKIAPFHLEPIPWTTSGFYYDKEDHPAKHPFYYAGLYYLQEPSAMLPGEILPLQPGDKVLDACAAPGGKSCQLLDRLDGTGLLVSNDISASRAMGLLKNIELSGNGNVFVTSADIKDMVDKYPAYFDKILLDVPCSGQGMFRKEPDLVKSYLEKGSKSYSPLQKEIALAGASMLKPGGMLVYSTCTFSTRENEEVIQYLLDHSDLELINIDNNIYKYFEKGKDGLDKCLRAYPFKIKGEGHFVALLKKKGESLDVVPDRKNIKCNLQDEFFQHLHKPFQNGVFETLGDKVYFHPEFDNTGLRTLRSGLLLGNRKKDRFEPSQALALSLRKEEFDQIVDFKQDDQNVIKYLKGETIAISDKKLKGWVLVCVEGHPLGFGKASNGMIKNKLEAGYRWL